MKKKVVALVLAAAMTFGLTACGGGGDSAGTDNASGAAAESADGGAESAEGGSEAGGEAAAAGNTYFDELQHLVVAFPTWTGAPADTQMVTDAVNEILREKYNIEVEFQISDSGSYNQTITLALSSGQQVDIMSTLFANYSNMVNQGYLMDLEEDGLFQTYGQGIQGVIDQKYIDACRVGGVLYGITNTRDYAVGRGCISVGTEFLDAIGYEAPADAEEIIPITEEELEDIFARLHAQFPDLEVYRPADNDLVQQTLVDQIGGNNFGVLLGNSDELKVVNLFETDEYMNFCKRVYNWNQLGYISKDAAADTTNVIVLVKEGVLMAYGTGGKPGSKVQESAGADKDMTIFQTREDYVSSSAVASYPWAIPISTANPEAAMVLMNELYTNPELVDLIIYGIEGTHYEITEDGFLDANAGTSPDTFSTLNWLYPNQFASTVIVGNTADLWERTAQFNEEARQSPASGFAFDSTNIATEQTAVTNVYDEYRKSLEFGFVDPEVAIPEMLQKMNSAGLQKIIEEKQAQLDAWAASK